MKPEAAIRYGAMIIIALSFTFATPFRDYAITILSLIVFFYSSVLLAACVVCPDRVAHWLKDRGWFK